MKLVVSEELLQKYPNVRIGVIVAAGIDNNGENQEISMLLKEIRGSIKSGLLQHPSISSWRKIYSSFGSKPSDYRSSAEALIRSVLKGRDIPHINKTVDLYNFISLKYVIPAGGEDLDKIEGNIYLRFAEGDETFVPLNSESRENPYKGEVIYCDDAGNVLCRRWNWRESDKTKLTENTENTVIVLEGFDNMVETATEELDLLVRKFCGATTQRFLINKDNPEAEW
ncbi:MAG: hypothetical protein HYW26_02365 [Candidatus Aenigmarchaeota archaeon]|nr:hypothetical protein [Candidatus Aenigmarchaeota archaeon]